ncbi:hypothetical protein LEN26_012629 [Aphanomyces euteiches]|nr:hypothetical protein LEN26_012629 [Aphanomyces euteiches]KAH9127306.1 hypothetical protein AeMF1_002379 [Aphanomyces euteiches]KAH9186408.1 hypothetical protein AeNC1_011614 [Aphanomyces euteiches]
MGVLDQSNSTHLLVELSPPNVCLGFLITKYVRVYEESAGLVVETTALSTVNPLHKLSTFLMEQIPQARSSPLSYKQYTAALDTIHPEWRQDLDLTMQRMCERSVDELGECLETMCLPSPDQLLASTPFGRFIRMLSLAVRGAFFDGLCSFRQVLRTYISSTDQTTAIRSSAVDGMARDAPNFNPPSTSPSVLFERYLDLQQKREFLGALDALHTYHNYAIHVQTEDTPDMKRFGPQYASLNIAILYWSFQYREEAMLALEEAIRVAQRARGMVCVAYALSYLLQWEPFDAKRAQQCLDMAGDVPILSLLATLSSVEHMHTMKSTGLPRSLELWLALKNALHVPKISGSKVSLEELRQEWQTRQTKLALATAAVWHRSGHRLLEQLYVQQATAAIANPSIDDLTTATCHSAGLTIQPTELPKDNESIYATALRNMVQVAETHPKLVHQPLFQQMLLSILFEWALAKCQFRRAHAYLHQWESLLAGALMNQRIESILARVRLYMRQEDFSEAKSLLLSLNTDKMPPYTRARILFHTAQVNMHDDAPFDALPALLECLALCEETQCDVVLPEAKLHLAKLYTAMDQTQDAIALLKVEFPHVVEHASLQLQAQYGLVLAEAYVLTQAWPDAVELLQQSQAAAMAVEDLKLTLNIGHLLVRVHHLQGDLDGREHEAKKCLSWAKDMQKNESIGIEDAFVLTEPSSILDLVACRE